MDMIYCISTINVRISVCIYIYLLYIYIHIHHTYIFTPYVHIHIYIYTPYVFSGCSIWVTERKPARSLFHTAVPPPIDET